MRIVVNFLQGFNDPKRVEFRIDIDTGHDPDAFDHPMGIIITYSTYQQSFNAFSLIEGTSTIDPVDECWVST